MPLLKEIATIRAGYSFRGAIEPNADGNVQVIQIKDITADAKLSTEQLIRVNMPDIKETYFVKKGDIIFISRGTRKQAVAITEELSSTIVGHQFFILKPNSMVIPEFLAWYINQKPAQRYFDEHSHGTNVLMIPREALEDLPVSVSPLELQSKTVHIHELTLKEKNLLEAIKERRAKLVEMALLKNLKQ